MALQFALDAPRTEPALGAQFHDPLFLFSKNLLTGGMVRTSAAALKSIDAFGLIASPPLARVGREMPQRRHTRPALPVSS